MDSLATISLSGFFNCPTNSICLAAFASESNFFFVNSNQLQLVYNDTLIYNEKRKRPWHNF